MSEAEREPADRLAEVDSTETIREILVTQAGTFHLHTLIGVLGERASSADAAGRSAEAALHRFLVQQAEDNTEWVETALRVRQPPPSDETASSSYDDGPDADAQGRAAERGAQHDDPREAMEEHAKRLLAQGDLDGAITAYREADGLPHSMLETSIGGVPGRYRLATALRQVGRYRDALDVLDHIDFHPSRLGMFSDLPGVHGLAAKILLLQGLLHEDRGDYELGRACFRHALEPAATSQDESLEKDARGYYAFSFLKDGRYREGVREARRVLDWARSLDHQTFVPGALNNLGNAYKDASMPREARHCWEQVVTLGEEGLFMGLSPVFAYLGLGDLASESGDTATALRMYDLALAWSPSSRDAIMLLLDRLKPDLTGDDDLRRLVWNLAETFDLDNDWQMHSAYLRAHAAHHAHGGDMTAAIACHRQLRQEALDRNMGHEARLHTRMLAERLADSFLPGARQEAFDLLWQTRDELLAESGTRGHPCFWADVAVSQYELMLRLLLDHDAPPLVLPDARGAQELAFDLHEEAKERAFLLHLARTELPAPTDAPEDLLHAEATLLEELAGLGAGRTTGEGGRAAFRRARITRELNDVWDALAPHAPGYVRIRRAQPTRFAELRTHLHADPDRADMAFVSYFCGDTSTTVFIYVPDTDRLTTLSVPVDRSSLSGTAERLRRTFHGDPHASRPSGALRREKPWRRSLDFLQDTAPHLLSFVPYVAGRPLLCVAGDGPLHAMPLHALNTDNGEPLARRHAVVQVLSATAVLNNAARHSSSASPDTNADTGSVFCAGVAAREDNPPEPLENDAELLKAAGWQVTALTGTDVTRTNVLKALRGHRIAHLTCHGHFDRAEPLDSGLLLANGTRRPSIKPTSTSLLTRLSHLLSVRDLVAARIRVDLLTLRACSTGLRADGAGWDLDGLAHAFLFSGARSVVASLWNVDRISSRGLLVDFYQRRRTEPGEPVWRSLWKAQLRLLERPEEPYETHLYHWAPLILIGDWR